MDRIEGWIITLSLCLILQTNVIVDALSLPNKVKKFRVGIIGGGGTYFHNNMILINLFFLSWSRLGYII